MVTTWFKYTFLHSSSLFLGNILHTPIQGSTDSSRPVRGPLDFHGFSKIDFYWDNLVGFHFGLQWTQHQLVSRWGLQLCSQSLQWDQKQPGIVFQCLNYAWTDQPLYLYSLQFQILNEKSRLLTLIAAKQLWYHYGIWKHRKVPFQKFPM